jgi:hypothetical protein
MNPAVMPSPSRVWNGVELQPGSPEYHAASLLQNRTLPATKKEVSGWIKESQSWPENRKNDPSEQSVLSGWKKTLDILNTVKKKSEFKIAKNENFYKVDLPDDRIAKMLDYDKPLSEQHPDVQSALAKLDPDTYSPTGLDYSPEETGQMIYMRMANSPLAKTQADASEVLRQAGIPGIRYLDQGSRAGDAGGTSNFVVFDPADMTILERNGMTAQDVLAQEGKGLVPPVKRVSPKTNKINDSEYVKYLTNNYAVDTNNNTFMVDSKPAFTGMVTKNGDIIETYDIEKAREVDWHHNAYMSKKALAEEYSGNAAPFYISEDGEIILPDGFDKAGETLKKKISVIKKNIVPPVKRVASQDEALRLAQERAALPIEQGVVKAVKQSSKNFLPKDFYPSIDGHNPLHAVMDWAKVRRLMHAARRGEDIPPILVDAYTNGNMLTGTHRAAAKKILTKLGDDVAASRIGTITPDDLDLSDDVREMLNEAIDNSDFGLINELIDR